MTVWTKRSDGSTSWSNRRSSNVLVPSSWSTANRPVVPLDGFTGYNTDFKGLESYIASTSKWRVLSGIWTMDTRPNSSLIDSGSMGYNSELSQIETWNGTEWTAL